MRGDRLIALGRFGAPQGVRGEIRIKSYTGEPLAIAGYGPLTDAGGARRFVLAALRALRDDMVVARVEGIATREAAAALAGVELYARRSQLPPPAADEYYYDDLIGLDAVTPGGVVLGRVAALLNHGAGDILEIAPPDGGAALLLAFTKTVVSQIDFVEGRLIAIPPPEIEDESGVAV